MNKKYIICLGPKSATDPQLDLLRASARRIGISIEIIKCQGFLDRPRSLLNHISGMNDGDFIICTYGYDVLHINTGEELLSWCHQTGIRILFSGEKECYHRLENVKEIF